MQLVNLLNVFSKFTNPLQRYGFFCKYAREKQKKAPRGRFFPFD